MPNEDDRKIQEAVRAKFTTEQANLERLEATPAFRGVVARRARLLRSIAARTRRDRPIRDADREILKEFLDFGAKAILKTGAQRGGDFLDRQLRGRWAENVVASMNLPQFKIAPFGPSGAAMPGQEHFRKTITTFQEIELLEGKRPDLLAFDMAVYETFAQADKARIAEWPDRLLDQQDEAILERARFGIEVKNSTWHFGKRREHHVTPEDEEQEVIPSGEDAQGEDAQEDAGRLSITVKQEELAKIVGWMAKTGKPVMFFQVLFDEIYCMSFSRMMDAIHKGLVYAKGDYLKDEKTGAGGKHYHHFFLSDRRHLCGAVTWPDESKARVGLLENGKVIPYVELRPAQAYDERPEAIAQEVAFAETALRAGLPVIMKT